MCIEIKRNVGMNDVLSGLFPVAKSVTPPPQTIQLAPRRIKLWEMKSRYHCPIIGTCLTVDELRKLAQKAGMEGWNSGSDYELHSTAVGLAHDRNTLSDLIQKELESKYEAVVKRFVRAKLSDDILLLWRTALEQGEVAAGLWAVMSHGRTPENLARIVYEDVHMLSHQAGAASRADLRKLTRLASINEEMAAQLTYWQDKFALHMAEKESIIRSLNGRLVDALGAEQHLSRVVGDQLNASQTCEVNQQRQYIAELEWRLEVESKVIDQEREGQRVANERVNQLEQTVTELRQELESAEETLDKFLQPLSCGGCEAGQEGRCNGPDFSGRCVLCVGGRTGMAEYYRQLVECRNGRFVHHDGGVEDNPKRLQALLAAADAVICPTDNVSHGAYYVVKRLCKQYSKPCVMLKNSGLTSFARGLATLGEPHNF